MKHVKKRTLQSKSDKIIHQPIHLNDFISCVYLNAVNSYIVQETTRASKQASKKKKEKRNIYTF